MFHDDIGLKLLFSQDVLSEIEMLPTSSTILAVIDSKTHTSSQI